ncbi:hypothetical protein BKA56DRAFT_678423 [Ilyonectria sp. MPI-CAGE-AT-0026]|nr:hypothetical protein BKA56DRAFT_678423 [Ilyonectria sp. MPI-CAGE-AT-0026]
MRLPGIIALAILTLVPIIIFTVPYLRRSVMGRINACCSRLNPRIYRWKDPRRDFISRLLLTRNASRDVELGPSQHLHDPSGAPRSKPNNTQPDFEEFAEHVLTGPRCISPPAPGGRTNVSSCGSNAGTSPELSRLDSHEIIGTSSLRYSIVPSFPESAAVIHNPKNPPVDDEVWDEYNDLFGEGHASDIESVSSPMGTPFHLETYHSSTYPSPRPPAPTHASLAKPRPESGIFTVFPAENADGRLRPTYDGNRVRFADLGKVLETG